MICEVCYGRCMEAGFKGGDCITTSYSPFYGYTVICDWCKKMVEAGHFRYDGLDDQGRKRYRQWSMGEWVPGELIAIPEHKE